jgi:hypothetical protein
VPTLEQLVKLVNILLLGRYKANDGIKNLSYYAYIFKLAIFRPYDDSTRVMLKPCVIDFFGPFKGWFVVGHIEAALACRPLII